MLVQLGPEAAPQPSLFLALILPRQEFQALLTTKSRASVDEWQTEMLLRAIQRVNVFLYSPKLSQVAHHC